MLWVVLFLVLALGALAVLVAYVVWLAHKTADVLSELQVLGEQASRFADLLGQLSPAPPSPGSGVGPGTASGPRPARRDVG